ncbi:MAG: RNA-binding protein S1, partial [Anaerotruncus colihominis]
SIKQAAPASPTQDRQPAPRALRGQGGDRPARPFQRRAPREVSYGFDRRQPITNENMSFEDMMSKFKQASDDKMSDLKRYTDMKRGSARNRPR